MKTKWQALARRLGDYSRRRFGIGIGPEGFCYLIVMTFVFCGALIRDINLLMLLFGMMMGPLLYSLWYGRLVLRRLELRRYLPEHVHAGDRFDVRLELINQRRWFSIWAIVVTDRVRRGSQGHQHPSRLMFLHLSPGQVEARGYRAQLLERGLYEIGPALVTTRFPLGLLTHGRRLGEIQRLLVWPRLGKLTKPLTRLLQQADPQRSQSRNQCGIVEGDFYGLRDWRPGDGQRWIHWRTTARRGELMVRQFERQKTPELILIVDLWQPIGRARNDEASDRIEQTVSFAATLVHEACLRGGSQLHIGIAGDVATVLTGMTGGGLLEKILDRLALVQATEDDTLSEILGKLVPRLRSGVRTIVISTRPNPLLANPKFSALRRDSRVQGWLHQLQWIDVGSSKLATLFDGTPSPEPSHAD